jgi:hypothetical protein
MKKRILLRVALLALVAIVGFGLVVAYATWIPTGISLASFKRLRHGMTRDEVRDIIGCPPGDYGETPPRFAIATDLPEGFATAKAESTELWTQDAGAIRVWYSANDRVVLATHHGKPGEEQGLAVKVRRWLFWFRERTP